MSEGKENTNGVKSDYYAKGSTELAEDTPLTLSRLETVSSQGWHFWNTFRFSRKIVALPTERETDQEFATSCYCTGRIASSGEILCG